MVTIARKKKIKHVMIEGNVHYLEIINSNQINLTFYHRMWGVYGFIEGCTGGYYFL